MQKSVGIALVAAVALVACSEGDWIKDHEEEVATAPMNCMGFRPPVCEERPSCKGTKSYFYKRPTESGGVVSMRVKNVWSYPDAKPPIAGREERRWQLACQTGQHAMPEYVVYSADGEASNKGGVGWGQFHPEEWVQHLMLKACPIG